MIEFPDRPGLLYRAQCKRCQALSCLVSLLTLGAVRRRPLGRDAFEQLENRKRAKLVLEHNGRILTNWRAATLAIGLTLPRFFFLAAVLVLVLGMPQ